MILLCGQQFFRACGMAFLYTWFATFLQETRGVNLADAGFMTGAVGLGAGADKRVVVAVVLKEGREPTCELIAEIEAAAAPGLATHAHPLVRVVHQLPTVLGGAKVQRAVLREQLAAAKAQV